MRSLMRIESSKCSPAGHEGDRTFCPAPAHPSRCRAVGDAVALPHPVALLHDRLLVDAGVLVRALVLDQVVDVDLARHVVRALLHVARTTMRAASTWSTTPSRRATTHTPESRATVDSIRCRPAAPRAQERHGLALHVGAHQRAVRVVVLQEGISEAATGPAGSVHVHQRDVLGTRLGNSPALRQETSGVTKWPFLSKSAFACAMTCFSSSSAE